MNTVEDRLRAALRETAGEVTRSPCRRCACTARAPARGMAGPAARRRWAAWLAPLAAAASVTAVVAASLAISTAFHGGHRAARGPAGPFAGVPPYYVVLAGKKPHLRPSIAQRQFAQVRATATGAVLARVTPPRPYGTFSAAAGPVTAVPSSSPRHRWKVTYKERGNVHQARRRRDFSCCASARAAAPGRLTPLPIPPAGRAAISGFALTRDGSKLAVALRGGIGGGPGPAIQVFAWPPGQTGLDVAGRRADHQQRRRQR